MLGQWHREQGLGELQVVVGAGSWVGDVPGVTGRGLVGICLVVVDGSDREGLFRRRAGGKIRAHPEGGFGIARVGCDEDIGALADSERHDGGVVRFYGHEVVGDDGELVAVDGEALNTFGS